MGIVTSVESVQAVSIDWNGISTLNKVPPNLKIIIISSNQFDSFCEMFHQKNEQTGRIKREPSGSV